MFPEIPIARPNTFTEEQERNMAQYVAWRDQQQAQEREPDKEEA